MTLERAHLDHADGRSPGPNRVVASALLVATACATPACGTRGDLSLGLIPAPNVTDAADAASGTESADTEDGLAQTSTSEDAAAGSDPNVEADASAGSSSTVVADSTSAPGETGACGRLPLPTQRYDFAGSDTEIVDRMGGPSGTLYGGVNLSGDGSVTLDGQDDYVDLPNGLLSSKTSATILVWTTAVDGPAYWRILDFGTNSEGEDPDPELSAVGTTYVALTTETGLDPSGMALFIGHGGASAEDRAVTDLRFDDEPVTLGVVLDGESALAHLYVNGALAASTPLTAPLDEIDDVNNWLGRSQYAADPNYPGTYTELRVYDRALSACEVAALTELGPDVLE